jgi:predicted amidohydrolase YtcJ
MATKYFGGKIYLGEGSYTDQIFVSDEGYIVHEQDFLLSKNSGQVNLEGSLMLPAFRDGHAHPLFAQREAQGLQISDCQSEKDLLTRLNDYVTRYPNATWIDGAVFDRSMPAAFHRSTLDKAAPEVPVVLRGDDHHTLWVNTK